MSVYQHRKLFLLRLLALLLRGLSVMLGSWAWVLMAIIILSPISPHLLITYQETTYGTYRYKHGCRYLGSRGMVNYMAEGGQCPFITIIDIRK